MSVLYLDDFVLLGKTFSDFKQDNVCSIKIVESLGFLINYKKSVSEQSRNSINYNKQMKISMEVESDHNWWLVKILQVSNYIRIDSYHCETFSDASLTGWCCL